MRGRPRGHSKSERSPAPSTWQPQGSAGRRDAPGPAAGEGLVPPLHAGENNAQTGAGTSPAPRVVTPIQSGGPAPTYP